MWAFSGTCCVSGVLLARPQNLSVQEQVFCDPPEDPGTVVTSLSVTAFQVTRYRDLRTSQCFGCVYLPMLRCNFSSSLGRTYSILQLERHVVNNRSVRDFCHKLHNKPSKHPHQAKNGPTSRLPLPKKHPHSSEKETPIQPHSTPFTPIREHYAPENKQFYNVNRKTQTPIQRTHLSLIYY